METLTQGMMFSETEYLTAENIMKDFSPKHFDDLDQYSALVSGQTFNADFLGSSVRKPNFTNCGFLGTKFEGNDATAALLFECDFNRTAFRDVCMNYSDLTFSKFHAAAFENCGCSNCDFSGVRMSSSKITGCSFMHSYFYDVEIASTTFVHCSFEEAEFKNAKFIDTDLSQAGLDFAVLDTVSFIRTMLPFWGVLRSFGGLNALRNSTDTQLQYTFDSRAIPVSEFFSKLESLQAYLYRKKLFFELANVFIFFGKQRDALVCILEGLQESTQRRDFRSIRHLCELASKNRFFTKRQLRQLYNLLISEDAISGMNHHQYLLYQAEIQGLKHLLVENPYGLPQITILIRTTFTCNDYTSLAVLLRFIDQSMAYYLPQAVYHISIYRNSPPQLELSGFESIPALIFYLSTIATVIFGSMNKSVSLFREICQANGIRLDNLQKKAHLKAAEEQDSLKTEHMRLENELLQLQIAKQELELKKSHQEIERQNSVLSGQDVPDLPLEVKQQISTIEFSIHSDDSEVVALRQGVLSADPK